MQDRVYIEIEEAAIILVSDFLDDNRNKLVFLITVLYFTCLE